MVYGTSKIDLFQVVMITIYISLTIVWILFYSNLKEQYIMHHIMPSMNGFLVANEKNVDKVLKM